MTRSVNRTPSEKEVLIRYTLTAEERALFTIRTPGPSGELGGYARLVNILAEMADNHPETVVGLSYYVDLNGKLRDRLCRYIQLHGSGGPNTELRGAFCRYFGDGSGFVSIPTRKR